MLSQLARCQTGLLTQLGRKHQMSAQQLLHTRGTCNKRNNTLGLITARVACCGRSRWCPQKRVPQTCTLHCLLLQAQALLHGKLLTPEKSTDMPEPKSIQAMYKSGKIAHRRTAASRQSQLQCCSDRHSITTAAASRLGMLCEPIQGDVDVVLLLAGYAVAAHLPPGQLLRQHNGAQAETTMSSMGRCVPPHLCPEPYTNCLKCPAGVNCIANNPSPPHDLSPRCPTNSCALWRPPAAFRSV